jgi:hypothetical protein
MSMGSPFKLLRISFYLNMELVALGSIIYARDEESYERRHVLDICCMHLDKTRTHYMLSFFL